MAAYSQQHCIIDTKEEKFYYPMVCAFRGGTGINYKADYFKVKAGFIFPVTKKSFTRLQMFKDMANYNNKVDYYQEDCHFIWLEPDGRWMTNTIFQSGFSFSTELDLLEGRFVVVTSFFEMAHINTLTKGMKTLAKVKELVNKINGDLPEGWYEYSYEDITAKDVSLMRSYVQTKESDL